MAALSTNQVFGIARCGYVAFLTAVMAAAILACVDAAPTSGVWPAGNGSLLLWGTTGALAAAMVVATAVFTCVPGPRSGVRAPLAVASAGGDAQAIAMRSLPLPPGSMGLPFLGETLQFFLHGPDKFVVDRLKRYGGVFKTHLFFQATVVVAGREALTSLLRQERRWTAPALPPAFLGLHGPHSVLNQDGERHRATRRAYQRMLGTRACEEFKRVAAEEASRLVAALNSCIEQRSPKADGSRAYKNLLKDSVVGVDVGGGGAATASAMAGNVAPASPAAAASPASAAAAGTRVHVSLWRLTKAFVLGVSAKFFLGASAPLGAEQERDVRLFSEGLFGLVDWELGGLTAYGRGRRARDRLVAFVRANIVAERARLAEGRAARVAAGEPEPYSFLAEMAAGVDEHGEPFSEERAATACMLFLWATVDQVAAVVCSLLSTLSHRKDVLRKLRDDLAVTNTTPRAAPGPAGGGESAGRSDGGDRSSRAWMTGHALDESAMWVGNSEYLNGCLHETLRLHYRIGAMHRTDADLEVGGFHLPRGWVVQPDPRGTFDDDAVYPRAAEFEPQRWVEVARARAAGAAPGKAGAPKGKGKGKGAAPAPDADEPVGQAPPGRVDFFPAGLGLHACPGMSLALAAETAIVAAFSRAFDWDVAPGSPPPRWTRVPPPTMAPDHIIALHRRQDVAS